MGQLGARSIDPSIELIDAEAEFERVRNIGQTPLEPIARMLDRIGSADPRPKSSTALTGDDVPDPDEVRALPPPLDRRELEKALAPISEQLIVTPRSPGSTGASDSEIPRNPKQNQ